MNTVKAIWENAKMDAHYETCFMINKKPKCLLILANLLWTIWYTTKVMTLYQICKIKGHNLVDEGYARPDSGCIDMVCKRCGWSSRTILY